MNETELKHIIALLLEDAKQVYRLSPNSATLTRIQMAEKALKQDNENSASEVAEMSVYLPGFHEIPARWFRGNKISLHGPGAIQHVGDAKRCLVLCQL